MTVSNNRMSMLWLECKSRGTSVNAIVFEECFVDRVTGRVAVCEEGMSILQTFKEGSVSLVCAVCGRWCEEEGRKA